MSVGEAMINIDVSVRKIFWAIRYEPYRLRLAVMKACVGAMPEREEEIQQIFNEVEDQLEEDIKLEEKTMQEIEEANKKEMR